jgi:copper chaperone
MKTVTYEIPSIHCMHCVHTIKMELADLKGVQSVTGDAESKKITVTYDSPADEEGIMKLLEEINYPAVKEK